VRASITPKSFGSDGVEVEVLAKKYGSLLATISSHMLPKNFGVVEALTDHSRKW
jgi:hypothetical protein